MIEEDIREISKLDGFDHELSLQEFGQNFIAEIEFT